MPVQTTIKHLADLFSVLITAATPDEAEFEIMEFQADHESASFGPVVLRVTGEYGACGVSKSA